MKANKMRELFEQQEVCENLMGKAVDSDVLNRECSKLHDLEKACDHQNDSGDSTIIKSNRGHTVFRLCTICGKDFAL